MPIGCAVPLHRSRHHGRLLDNSFWMVNSLHFAVQLAEDLAKKLQTGHGAGCAWRGNACDENLLSYPPIPQAQAVAAYHDRLSNIAQLSELPKLAPTAVKAITATHRCLCCVPS